MLPNILVNDTVSKLMVTVKETIDFLLSIEDHKKSEFLVDLFGIFP